MPASASGELGVFTSAASTQDEKRIDRRRGQPGKGRADVQA
jgi:hypothetical protein